MTDQTPKFDRLESSPPLAGERVAFTGTLASMTHREAYEVVEKHGGTPSPYVSRQLTILVIGEEGWPLEDNGQPSVKLQQVLQKQAEGIAIRIINESTWLKWLGLDERERDVHRWYTPAMLSKLLDVSVASIRRWARIGLIHPVNQVMKLPYFDFREVSSARRLAELIDAEIPLHEIEKSLKHLTDVLPEVDRPLAQLQVLAQQHRLTYRDGCSLIEARSGQRLFDFSPPAPVTENSDAAAHTILFHPRDEPTDSPELHTNIESDDNAASIPLRTDDVDRHWEEWYETGCRLLDSHHVTAAIEAFRMSLMDEPGHPEVNFHLAEALYRNGNLPGALERYYVAVEADHQLIEAWTQLGCVHAELMETDQAIKAFQIALEYHPDYPDAHYHLAELWHKRGETVRAVPHWQAYLSFDQRGPWAEVAMQRLHEVGKE
ncbi:MAG: tetratricopeptide repeat protein [Planctomycetota bacterium]|nr:tetratricopeptide repeat protein [Planctomycetota bacterium]